MCVVACVVVCVVACIVVCVVVLALCPVGVFAESLSLKYCLHE